MKQSQLGRALFAEQMKWAAWFYGIMIILTLGITIANHWGILGNLDINSTTSNVFMLIIGLLYSYGFLDYYFKLGGSRKKFFKASLFASVLLSVILAFAMVIMISLFEILVPALGFAVPWTDLLISSGILSFIQSIGDYFISHFFYLLIGWFIGIGFYRFRWKIGLLFILISSPFTGMAGFLQEQIWIESTIIIFYAIFLIMIVILIGFIYRLTKNTAIRL
ncbi:hypothetical protein [Oceanobacillus jeddahense]|uniref:hypothetical protein n=1 Tax=Oceanobacillus jeddahense TaxID=1462527 RepID=UPI0005958AAF|nr:hypothetical protein [Oceanobacillus jeddahense]